MGVRLGTIALSYSNINLFSFTDSINKVAKKGLPEN